MARKVVCVFSRAISGKCRLVCGGLPRANACGLAARITRKILAFPRLCTWAGSFDTLGAKGDEQKQQAFSRAPAFLFLHKALSQTANGPRKTNVRTGSNKPGICSKGRAFEPPLFRIEVKLDKSGIIDV